MDGAPKVLLPLDPKMHLSKFVHSQVSERLRGTQGSRAAKLHFPAPIAGQCSLCHTAHITSGKLAYNSPQFQ